MVDEGGIEDDDSFDLAAVEEFIIVGLTNREDGERAPGETHSVRS